MTPLERLRDAGRVGALDVAVGEMLVRRSTAGGPALAIAAALASADAGRGHVCTDLSAEAAALPELGGAAAWLDALLASDAVSASGATPLILDAAGRLYLHRWWSAEQRVAAWLRDRCARPVESVDPAWLRGRLEALFETSDPSTDARWLAALVALGRSLTVISGGPGTGKTTSVVKLLALLLERRGALRVALAAPTGKAAARLADAVGNVLAGLALDDAVRAAIPTEASTLHRLLGAGPGGFRYGANERLPFDVVVVDEASMIDLRLLDRLLAALADDARLILLGDRNQLASVEAGAVLGDLCRLAAAQGPSAALRSRFAVVADDAHGGPTEAHDGAAAVPAAADEDAAPPSIGRLGDVVVELRRNFRFDAASGIGALAAAAAAGDVGAARAAFESAVQGGAGSDGDSRSAGQGTSPGVTPELTRWVDATDAAVALLAVERFDAVLAAADVAGALEAFARFRVLCAHRRGAASVESINREVERVLAERRGVALGSGWYRGRPLLVTQNDAGQRLWNGDIGLVWPGDDGTPLVHFPSADGRLRSFLPSRLPPHQTVFAMTVHKSQGSEFDEVAFVLPPEPSPVLTRELVYTAITRARSRVLVAGPEHVLGASLAARVQRRSGLADALAGG